MSVVTQGSKKKPELSEREREKVLQVLLRHFNSEERKLQHGTIEGTAVALRLCRHIVGRIWKRARENYAKDGVFSASSHKAKYCGRKAKDFSRALSKISAVPLNRRSTLRSLAKEIEVPRATLYRRFKSGSFKRVSSAIKPLLTEENKRERVDICRSFVYESGYFDPMFDRIHIDEKWFYLTKAKRSYYVTNDEETPHRQCKSKRFIPKIMFLAAVARPRPGFDGKLGLWPFVEYTEARRSSKNRPRGALVTTPSPIIDRKEIKKVILEKVLPAIRQKFPIGAKAYPLFIQQDKATPHLLSDDADLHEAAFSEGWSIKLTNQPANSPDLNLVDLGFFNSVQAAQERASVNTLDDLIREVRVSFNELTPDSLDNVFLTLQSCMEKILEVDGNNNYKIPHMGDSSSVIRQHMRAQLPS